MEWPRIPLPGWPDGSGDGAADELAASAARGRELAALLDHRHPRPRRDRGIAAPRDRRRSRPVHHRRRQHGGRRLRAHGGLGPLRTGRRRHARPGPSRRAPQYRIRNRPPWDESTPILGDTTFDVYLNDRAYWRNVPAAVWRYKLGGYQVLKKWLSYREHKVLHRPLHPEEVHHFTDTARRIAAILMLMEAV